MRSRFLGASSYDDDDEEDAMDMSGFIGSTTVEQPPVIERPRKSAPSEPMGNMGPRSVPPPSPARNMGYAPRIVTSAASNEGSPLNPLWAHDETLGPNWLPVASKTGGLGLVTSSVLLAQGWKAWGPRTRMMAFTGALMYAHPVLGLGHGLINQYMRDTRWKYVAMVGAHLGIPAVVIYKKMNKM